MAEAYGKLTGRPGVCMVTRGPGATHASNGVHTAFQDSTPMLLLIGQVARDTVGREGFQELDYRAMYGAIAKWATQVDDAARCPRSSRAPSPWPPPGGPVRSSSRCPRTCSPSASTCPTGGAHRCVGAAPRAGDMARLEALLGGARAPLAIVGRAAGRRRPAPTSPPSPRRRPCRSPRRSAARTTSTTPRPPTPGTPRWRWTRAGQAHPRGRPAAGHRRAPGRDPDRRLHARAPRRADPAPGPRAPRSRRARRRLPARAGDRRRPRGLRGRGARAGAGGAEAGAPGCSRPRTASTSATWARRASCPGRCRCPR